MRNAPARIEIDLQVDEEVLEETLDIIESFLDDLGQLTLVRSAHICVEDDSHEARESQRPYADRDDPVNVHSCSLSTRKGGAPRRPRVSTLPYCRLCLMDTEKRRSRR